jgi:2-succinyl-6-hydroxy-2,4-cyclohexadiene-1-carboxylate synthase
MSGRAERHDVHVGEGLRLRAEVRGTGPAVLLLHGFTGSMRTWDALAAELSGTHTTIAVDLPGHGASGAPDDPRRYALPRLADDLARLLDALEVQRAALLGYSMGGRAALHTALRHPERVSALVLESASPGIADEAERTQRVVADEVLAGLIERDGVEAFVARWEALPLWESQRALPAAVRESLRAHRLANDAAGLANSLRGAGAGAEPSVAARLGEIAVPALLVAGALDTKYVAIGEAMARAIPDARLEVVREAGHAVHLERPAELAALVQGFLWER